MLWAIWGFFWVGNDIVGEFNTSLLHLCSDSVPCAYRILPLENDADEYGGDIVLIKDTTDAASHQFQSTEEHKLQYGALGAVI